ncbi:hypothetical protein ACIP9H_33980 [Streptomyces sp. NPDC088732]|uniref:hypothetical protein n=1 Tax=Streptomyces sp. NPDC088732 TaxID=3365879 RepID=UPI0038261747
MQTLMDFFHRHTAYADKVFDLVNAGIIALITWGLTKRAQIRSDREAEKALLRVQADALTIAAGDLQGAEAAGYLLWDRPLEQLRTIFLAGLIGQGRLFGKGGRSDWPGIAAGLSDAGEFIGRERLAGKQFAMTLREPVMRLATAAAPLVRHSDTAVATAAQKVVAVAIDTKDKRRKTRMDEALEEFNRAVRRYLEPSPTLWARIRRRTETETSA